MNETLNETLELLQEVNDQIDRAVELIDKQDELILEQAKVIDDLKAQIEKMKCCGNCKYCYEEKYDGINCDLYDGKTYIPDIEKRNCDKWELAE